ncbi:MAG TPA: hypothetical protein VG675_05805 [Bryobacteraceae bacterium]|nr:hypothetical protein [Bryobacteraceae bacterium]
MRAVTLLTVLGVAVCLPGWAADNAGTTATANAASVATTPSNSTAPSVDPQTIIKEFAAKEAEFAEARNNYTYRQTVRIEELDPSGNPTGGKYEMVEDIIFSPEGKRVEKVVYAPVPTLRNILLTPEDEEDLRNVQPFVLTTSEVPEYEINYLGREKVDEIGTYVFSVKPKKLVQGKRYFEGQIWVDDRDLQIVKTYGKGVGVIKHSKDNQFPKFETYRQQIDGKYWFPTYTRADDTLHFEAGPQRIRMIVKYENYKRYQGSAIIKYGGVVNDNQQTQPQMQPPAQQEPKKP